MLRRVIGIIMFILGLVGVVISVAGIIYGRQAIDQFGGGLDNTLSLTSDTLNTAVDSLELAKTTIGDVNNGLDTVGVASSSIAKTITETRPLLDQVGEVVTQDAAASVEAMQTAIPNIAQVAGAIDSTLTALNDFRIDENILGFQLQYDLGVDYDPAVPFDETINGLGDSLDGLPERLRSVEDDIAVTSANLQLIGDSIVRITADLDTINGRVAEVIPLLDQYVDIVNRLDDSIQRVRSQVTQQLGVVKNVLTFVLIWWGMPQLALVMIGWDFFAGRRGASRFELKADVMEEIKEEIEEVKEDIREETEDEAKSEA
ncbi:MAG: hypothetical protein AB1791_17520 [Chloroflexota bacterium]